MMTMDQTSAFGDFNVYSSGNDPFSSSNSPPMNNNNNDIDVDWSVFENAGKFLTVKTIIVTFYSSSLFFLSDRYLLRDDSAWITRLSKDFWWNLDRISEMITSDVSMNSSRPVGGKFPSGQPNFNGGKTFPQSTTNSSSTGASIPQPMQFNGVPPRKIVGQRAPMNNGNPYRNPSMFNNGFASPPPSSSSSSSSAGSAIVRPNNSHHYNPMSEKSNLFQAFSSMSITNGHDQDMEYNPFQSKISFDNHMWTGNGQQAIPWQ
jgi:hypothetical protein